MATPDTAKLLELVARALPRREPDLRDTQPSPVRESIRFLDWSIPVRRPEPAANRSTPLPVRPSDRPLERAIALPLHADDDRLAAPDEPVRYFRAGDCCEWRVREMETPTQPWARGPRCLVFESDAFARRVWRYPAHWRTLSDAALEALSWRV